MVKRSIVVVLASLTVALTLTGCFGSVLLPPRSTSTPVFADERIALSAARQVHRDYTRERDKMLRDSSFNSESIAKLAGPEVLMADLLIVADARLNGWTYTGHQVSRRAKLVSFKKNADRQKNHRRVVVLLSCDDPTGMKILDANGGVLVEGDILGSRSYELSFDWRDGTLTFADSAPATEDVC